MNTQDRLAEVDDLWQRVYDRIDSMLADMQALRPSLDEADEMTPEQVLAAHEKADAEELHALRECVHDVVKDALVTLTWREPCSRQSGEGAEVCAHGPSAYDTASGTPVRARIGTVYFDPETNEYVMPPDFAGDDELRWKADVSQTGNCPVPGNIVASEREP